MLNQVPREMLLLLKTNDLLRGIETCLNTRNASSSFIHMTKCCIRLISSYERELKQRETNATYVKNLNLIKLIQFYFNSYLKENFNLFKVYSYELFLYIFNI